MNDTPTPRPMGKVSDEAISKVFIETGKRLGNVRRSLEIKAQEAGGSIVDIDRALLFHLIQLLKHDHHLPGEGIEAIISDILASLEAQEDIDEGPVQ